VDASFLIPMNAGANGGKGTDPTPPEVAKAESPDAPSFGVVMTQVSEGAAAKGDATGQTGQPDQAATGSTSETGLLASLQMAFVGQIPLAAAPSQDGAEGQTDVPVDGAASAIAESALALTMPDSTQPGGDAASRPFPSSAFAPSGLPVGPATMPAQGTGDAGLAHAAPMSLAPEELGGNAAHQPPPPAGMPGEQQTEAATVQMNDRALAEAKEQAAREAALGNKPGLPGEAGAHESGQEQDLSPGATAAGVRTSPTAEETAKAGPEGKPEGLPAEPLRMPGYHQETEFQAGDAGQDGSGAPQPAVQQDAALREQAAQLAAAGGQDKPTGAGQKPATKTGFSPASERLGIGANEPAAFRQDEIVKVAAVAPVTPPSEAPATPSVQALSLEVDRPGLGQVALRVVLADQTVHAKVTTDHVEVRDFLVTRQGQLEAGLKASGLDMGEFRVDVNQHRQGQAHSGWPGAHREAWGQGRQQDGQPAPDAPDYLTPDAWAGEAGTANGAWQARSLSVFA